jgi:hypothetical protein
MIEASLFLIMKFDEILLEGANKKVALRNYRITKLKAKPSQAKRSCCLCRPCFASSSAI